MDIGNTCCGVFSFEKVSPANTYSYNIMIKLTIYTWITYGILIQVKSRFRHLRKMVINGVSKNPSKTKVVFFYQKDFLLRLNYF